MVGSLFMTEAPAECADAARYTATVNGRHLTSAVVRDTCTGAPDNPGIEVNDIRPKRRWSCRSVAQGKLATEPKQGSLPSAAASVRQWPSLPLRRPGPCKR